MDHSRLKEKPCATALFPSKSHDSTLISIPFQVLDLGFNLLRVLPVQSFRGISDLTLLALDGNPMATLPEEAFRHLNSSLRGLSLGGRFLTCDCKVRWVARWIREYDLQVTSRERNPQFCGHPQHLRDKNFYQLGLAGEFHRQNVAQENKSKDILTRLTLIAINVQWSDAFLTGTHACHHAIPLLIETSCMCWTT
jgi:hypothetical protein